MKTLTLEELGLFVTITGITSKEGADVILDTGNQIRTDFDPCGVFEDIFIEGQLENFNTVVNKLVKLQNKIME